MAPAISPTSDSMSPFVPFVVHPLSILCLVCAFRLLLLFILPLPPLHLSSRLSGIPILSTYRLMRGLWNAVARSAQSHLSNAQGRPVFNMKIIVRGLRGTGKSALLRRLRNKPFETEYIPTPEIDVVNVSWSYKATDELIKLEAYLHDECFLLTTHSVEVQIPTTHLGVFVQGSPRRNDTPGLLCWNTTHAQAPHPLPGVVVSFGPLVPAVCTRT